MTLFARIEGYASLFDAPDLNGDVVLKGAFKAALARKSASGVKMLYQHLAEAPIGRWTHLEEDRRGLLAVGEFVLETQAARETHALARAGALDGLSIGFQTVKAAKSAASAVRLIVEADLWEISVVTFPMAAGARIARVGAPESRAESPAALFAEALKGAASILSA